MDYKKLGNNIRNARLNLNMTQEELAEKIDVSSVFISQIENTARKPSLETIYKISNVLLVSIDDLVKQEKVINEDISELQVIMKNKTIEEIDLATALIRTLFSKLSNNQLNR